MSNEILGHIDEYCQKNYGHTNWGWLSTYDVTRLEEGEYGEFEIEGEIVFFKEEFNVADRVEINSLVYLNEREQIQEDIRSILKSYDSEFDEYVIDNICQVIVDRLGNIINS